MSSSVILNPQRVVSLVAVVMDFVKLYESLSDSEYDEDQLHRFAVEFCHYLEGYEIMETKIEYLTGLISRMFSHQVEHVADRTAVIDRAALALASQNRDGIRSVSSRDERAS